MIVIFGRADNIDEYNLLFSKIKTEDSIIVGDFNAHNPLWDSKLNDAKGRALLEVSNNHDLVILNNGQPTLSIHDTTPDITLDRRQLVQNRNGSVTTNLW